MLAGKLDGLISDMAFAQQVSELVLAVDGVVVGAAGHEDEAGVLRLGFFGKHEGVVFFADFAVRRAKDLSEAGKIVELVSPHSAKRAAQAGAKEDEPRVPESDVDGRISAHGDAGNGARRRR